MSSSCCSRHSNQYFTFTKCFFSLLLHCAFSVSGVTGIKAGAAVLVHTKGSSKPVSCGW